MTCAISAFEMNQTLTLSDEPLWRELADTDAFATALRLAGQPGFLFLDSAMGHERLGRFSYLCCDPAESLPPLHEGVAGVSQINALLASHQLHHLPHLPPLQGGLAGYIGYEFGQSIEPQLRARSPAPDIPPLQLKVYDCVLAFDHIQDKAWAISTGYPARDPAARHARAAQRMDAMLAKLGRPRSTACRPR